jgi:hypothetical protein
MQVTVCSTHTLTLMLVSWPWANHHSVTERKHFQYSTLQWPVIWHCIDWTFFTDVSGASVASVFRIVQDVSSWTSLKISVAIIVTLKTWSHAFSCCFICVSVTDSSIKSTEEKFEVDFQETLSESLLEKFNTLPCKEERILRIVKWVHLLVMWNQAKASCLLKIMIVAKRHASGKVQIISEISLQEYTEFPKVSFKIVLIFIRFI